MKKIRLSNQEIAGFCRGFALLLHSGIGLSDGLFLLGEEEAGLQPLLRQMGHRMDSGSPLSVAMEESGVFPTYVTGMVQVGERSGRMEEALNALADYYEDRERMDRQIRNALAYPAVIMLLMLVVIAVLLIKVLPVFDEVYASLGGHLTGFAGGLLRLGQILQAAMPILCGLLALAAIVALLFAAWEPFRQKVLALWRTKWGDRGVSEQFNNARFARALAMGLSSGLPLEEAVALAAALLADVPGAADRCETCSVLLQEGKPLADALGETALLPAASCRMLQLGLRGGNGDQVMEEIARRLMEDAGEALEKKVSRVEPTMVLTASLLVGVILLSVMLPLMNIMSSIG